MNNKAKCEVIPSRKEEFKLVKKLLRKHGCLRAYRRKMRTLLGRSLLEDFETFKFSDLGYRIDDYPLMRSSEFWSSVDEDLYNQQLRYPHNK